MELYKQDIYTNMKHLQLIISNNDNVIIVSLNMLNEYTNKIYCLTSFPVFIKTEIKQIKEMLVYYLDNMETSVLDIDVVKQNIIDAKIQRLDKLIFNKMGAWNIFSKLIYYI